MRASDASLRVMSTTSNYEMTSAPPAVPRWLANVLGTDELAPVAGPVPAVGARRPPHDTILRIYHEHHAALLRFATLVAPEDCQAEDLVQDAFVRLYRSWPKVEDTAKLGGYLRVTVLNLARGRGRRLGVARRHRSEPMPDAASAEHHAMGRIDNAEVVQALQSLSRRQRECLVLRYFEGYSESEIADALSISVGSARTHVHRGTAALRAAMGGAA